MKRMLLSLVVAILFATPAFAKIIHVPADQPTIQAAINAAAKDDTVLVAKGTYYENIDFKGKAITVASRFLMDADTSHISKTIINGSRPSDPNRGSVVSFVSGEDTTSVIYGFTITGGTGTLYSSVERVGGGIYCNNSSARIAHNKIVNNSVTHDQRCFGGGIGIWPLQNVQPVVIENNVVESNSINALDWSKGGGIFLIDGKIVHNIIRQNKSQGNLSWGMGGGIAGFCDETAINRPLVTIAENTITNNQAISNTVGAFGGGVDIQFNNIRLINNTITHNLVVGTAGQIMQGGGVRTWGVKDSVLVKNNNISFNSFIIGDCRGGGLLVNQCYKATIQGNRFEGNEAVNGGGIRTAHNRGCIVTDNEFITNFAAYGGGICDYDSNPFTISNNVFIQNRATNAGGGLLVEDSDVVIVNNIFTANESQWGGGVCSSQYDPAKTFTTQIINNTITTNVADSAGGIGVWYHKKVVSMNNICWGNNAPFAPEVLVEGGVLNMAHSDIKGGAANIVTEKDGKVNWLAGNIDADPLWVADSLSNDSKCIGAGIHLFDFGNGIVCQCPGKDINGRSRPYPAGTKPDIGAWESVRWDPVTGVESQLSAEIPQAYALHQNHPNPFNPSTAIEFALPKASLVTLKIYDLLGNEVATLVAEKLPAGQHQRVWEAKDLASGVYLYRLQAGNFVAVKKLILMH
ncbi:MAG: hypothetical protein DKINENOH_05400 [bacterium]|nr:hypothetical protein [bacterium]